MSLPRFDVFLSHNSRDKPVVARIAQQLQRAGLEPWLDTWCLTPGGPWQTELAGGLKASATCAIFFGPAGMGNWEDLEFQLALDRMANDHAFRAFPVLLPGLPEPFDPSALPPFLSTRTWVDFRGGANDARAVQHLINAIKGLPFGSDPPVRSDPAVQPYRGLQAFDEDQAEFFFGRDSDIQRLLEKLKAGRFLAVLGPSGTGKSSLVRAGLLPALRRGALPDSDTWMIGVLTPGAQPITALAVRAHRLGGSDALHGTLDQMRSDARTLHLVTSVALADRPQHKRAVWVIDQFEEIFTLCRDAPERAQFIGNLLYAASIPGGPCAVILTLRADFYPSCAAYPELAAHIAAHQSLVSPMDADGLRQVIEEPARKVGLEFEAGLVDTIMDDVGRQPGALPLLEHALLELWERRRGRMLTLEAYRESGGVEAALAKRAEKIFEGLGDGQQAAARRILLRLTQPGEGTEDTRRRAAYDELVTRSGEREDVAAVVGALVDARLLTASQDPQTNEGLVDVSHEALIRGWPRLRAWIDEDRAGLRVHGRLSDAAHEWKQRDQDDGVLYRGTRLAEALEWRAVHDAELNELERGFLDASQALHARERQAATRRLWLTVAGLIVALTVISIFAIAAVDRGQEAARQRDAARSRELAGIAEKQLEIDPELSVHLASEALRVAETQQAEETLRLALLRSPARATLVGHRAPVSGVRFSPDGRFLATASMDGTARLWETATGQPLVELGHSSAVQSAEFSADGKYLVTASRDTTPRVWQVPVGLLVAELRGHNASVRTAAFDSSAQHIVTAGGDGAGWIWDALSGSGLFRLGHAREVTHAEFSSDGRMAVTASADGTAKVWEANTGRLIAELGHGSAVIRARFSPIAPVIATVGLDGVARLWNATTGGRVAELRRHTLSLTDAAFSPDGIRLITSSADATAGVWDVSSHVLLHELRGHRAAVQAVAVSPDGQLVGTVSLDRSARLWNAISGGLLAELRGHQREVTSLQFSPDSRLAATASFDGTARIWSADMGRSPVSLEGHTDQVYSAHISSDGRLAVTASRDRTARIWETRTGQVVHSLPEQRAPVISAVFSRDDQRVLTASLDGAARVWSAVSREPLAELMGEPMWLYNAQFSPDEERVITAGADGVARIWDISSAKVMLELRGHDRSITSAAFSPDGQLIVTSSEDGTARLWDANTGSVKHELHGHTKTVRDAAFSFDGRLVVTSGEDGTARMWESSTGKPTIVLAGHIGSVYGVAFSPDDRLVVTASEDRTARVWDAHTGGPVAELRAPMARVWSAAFSPDGQHVITASEDGSSRIYPREMFAPREELLGLARTRATRELTVEERQKYLLDQ